MKLTHLDLKSFRSYQGIALDINAPRVVFAGLNGSGKTGIKNAIRWLLTGHCEGTDAKGAGAEVLIPVGEKKAEAFCVIDGIGRVHRQFLGSAGGGFAVEGFTGTGQVQHQALMIKLQTSPAFVGAVLDTDAFLNLGHVEAKAMVLSLLGVKISIGDTSYTLDELDAHYKQAFEDRKLAKRTLQQFGTPPKPQPQEMPALEAIEGQLKKLRTLLGEQRQAVGSVHGKGEALTKEAERLSVTLNAPVPADLSVEIATVERELAALETVPAVPAAIPAKGDPARLHVLKTQADAIAAFTARGALGQCVMEAGIGCNTQLASFSNRERAIREEMLTLVPSIESGPQKPAESPQTVLRKRLADLTWRQQQRTASFEATKTANHRRSQILEELNALPDTGQQEAEIEKTQARIANGEKLLRDARTHFEDLAACEKAVHLQSILKADVDRLEALCDQLGPKGVRAQALASAMGTFEAAVNPYVQPFGWTIGFDVDPWQVSANGRPVETYSRSERYRIGIALQLGIAQLSGLNFAVVDEIDMLDVENRKAVSAMLVKAPLEQILILGTREPSQAFAPTKGVISYRLAKDGDRTVVKERSAA